MQTIRYKQSYKNNEYFVYVNKTKDVFISVYIARYLFLSQLKSVYPLRRFYLTEGRPSEHDKKEILPYLNVVKIEHITNLEPLFKKVE